MREIDGINIGNVSYDRVCLNCRYWRVNVQFKGAADGVICTRGQGHTNPNDSCSMFSPNFGADAIQDPNGINEKRNKMDVWKW